MLVIFVYYATQIYGKIVLSLKMALISRLETNISKINILDLTGFVNDYTTVGPSNLISVGILSLMYHGKCGVH